MSDIRQFKLTTGDELICKVIEWPDDSEVDIVIENAYTIMSTGITEGYRYYGFRPWMTLQEGSGVYVTININHVVGESMPDKRVLDYYNEVVSRADDDEEKKAETIEDWLNRLRDAVEESSVDSDKSVELNVISFPNKDKLH